MRGGPVCGTAVFVASIAGGGWLIAQGTPGQVPTFRAGIDLVQVDVSVLDKNHKPVRGLKAADFTILEDSKPQTILGFSEVDVPDAPPVPVVDGKPVTWMRDVSSDVQSNSLAAGRLVVLLIDDALIPAEPKIVANTKAVTHALVDKLGPTDRMSVVFSENGRKAQGFTSDHARLHATVDTIIPGRALYTLGWESIPSRQMQMHLDPYHNPHPGPDPDAPLRDGSFATLQLVAESLMSSPERRKALVLVSPGVPVNAFMAGKPMESGGAGGVSTMMNREANIRLDEQIPELFRRLQRANVAVYAIDPSGPLGIGGYAEQRILAIPQMHEYSPTPIDPSTQEGQKQLCDNHNAPWSFQPSSNPAGGGSPLPACFVPEAGDLARFVVARGHDFLLAAAESTGGRAYIANEDFAAHLEEVLQENGSYYLLGYRAPTSKPGDLHRLRVTVNRPGVEVRTRSGYYTPQPPTADPKKAAATPAMKAVGGVFAQSDVPMQAVLAPVASPKGDPSVLVVLGLQIPTRDKPFTDTVDVQLRAFTPDGYSRTSQARLAYVAVRPSAVADVLRYEVLSSIVLKPGRYQLRVGAYSGFVDQAGSVYADVEVPDFAKAPLSLSGVMMNVSPALPAQPVEVATALVPLVPTASRSFQKLDRVMAFVRAYLGSKSRPAEGAADVVTVTANITNDRGSIVFSKTETLAAERFAGSPRAADVRFELPIVTLPRGQYLLTIAAEGSGASASRLVRFDVH